MKKQAQSPDLFLSGLEKDYYLHIWNLYKDGIENIITGISVQKLFSSSGISNKELSAIWNMVQSEKMSQKLGEGDFMRGMKLVALRQNGKELAQMTEFFKTELPLPRFKLPEAESLLSTCVENMQNKLNKVYMKWLSSYLELFEHKYKRSKIYSGWNMGHEFLSHIQNRNQDFNPKKTYEVLRRFNDFVWLHEKLISSPDTKGYVIPPLPDKKTIGKTDPQFVLKRKNDLEVYLNLISCHPILQLNKSLKDFVTIEGVEEWEQYKTDPNSYYMEYAKGVFSSLKTFNIHNAYTHANAYVTTQYLDQTEPKQFELKFHPGNLDHVSITLEQYLPVLKIFYELLQLQIHFQKEQMKKYEELGIAFNNLSFVSRETDETKSEDINFLNTSDGTRATCELLLKTCSNTFHQIKNKDENANIHLSQAKDEVKAEIMRLRGIENALNERRTHITNYKHMEMVYNAKSEKLNKEPHLNPKLDQEVKNLEPQVLKLKSEVEKINKNLKSELEHFQEDRINGYKEIMETFCKKCVVVSRKNSEFYESKLVEFSSIKLESDKIFSKDVNMEWEESGGETPLIHMREEIKESPNIREEEELRQRPIPLSNQANTYQEFMRNHQEEEEEEGEPFNDYEDISVDHQ